MQHSNVEFRVLVKGKPITEYAHNGNLYLEGREGSDFEIEFQNRNPYRVEAIITVDGLSVIDGKEGSQESSGYLVEANSTLRVPGWKLDNEQAAKFVFSGKGGSYATQTTGSSRNNGVIGCMVYAERHRRPVTKTRTPPAPPPMPHQPTVWFNGPPISGGFVNTQYPSSGILHINTVNTWSHNTATSATTGGTEVLSPYDTPRYYSAQASAMDWMDTEQERGVTRSMMRGSTKGLTNGLTKNAAPQASLNNLGTGFGHATTFETETATFDRGDMLGVLVLYYDNARGLKARGIQVGRPSRVKHTAQTPQAFPGLVKGCEPPPGWQG